MLLALAFHLAFAAEPAPAGAPAAPVIAAGPVAIPTATEWATTLADAIVALPDAAARRARIAAEMAVTTDAARAERLGQALATLLEAGAVAPEVLRARLVLALVGDTAHAADAPYAPPAPAAPVATSAAAVAASIEYRKRAYVVSEADGEWGVYRVYGGKPVSARTFAHATDDEPLKTRLRTARVASYVSAGVLAGGAVALGYTTLVLAIESAILERPNGGTFAAITGVSAVGCVVGAAVIPVVTFKRQGDIHNYYDEARAREVVEGYDGRLRQRYGVTTPSASLEIVASPTSVALVGAF